MVLKRKRASRPIAYCTDSSGKNPAGLTAIYVLCADGGDPRYVGQTVQPRERMAQHLRCSDHTHRSRWIQSVLRSGVPLHMEIVDWTDAPGPGERAWIAGLREEGCRLVNSTDGGDTTLVPAYPGIRAARAFAAHGHPDYPDLRQVVDAAVDHACAAGALALMTLDRDFALIVARGRNRGWL